MHVTRLNILKCLLGIAVQSGKDKTMQQTHKGQTHEDTPVVFIDEEEMEDSIPGTPPSKKFKCMFFSAISTKNKMPIKQQSKSPVILVEDSDVESD